MFYITPNSVVLIPYIVNIDYHDPEEILLCLADEHGICFLDSSKQDKQLGRYSYIAVDPFELINSKNDLLTLNHERVSGNPFDFLNTRLSFYQTQSMQELPPFQGGAMGYFGYDLLHHLENIPRAKQDNIAVPDMIIGLYDLVISFDHEKREAWIISQGFPELEARRRKERAKQRAEWILQKLSVKPTESIPWNKFENLVISSNFSKENYCLAVQNTIDYIYAGDIFQANLSQCFSSILPEHFKAVSLYRELRKKNPSPFSAFLQFDDLSIASASPERFIRLDQYRVQTRPIKGTRRRSLDPETDENLARELLNSPKDQAENTMIVDLMRNDLSRVCTPHSIEVTQLCGLETYETVHHLVSVIEADLKPDFNAIDLLKACFPGGSITGAPKMRAMEIIYEIEPASRGIYCGSIGYIGFDGKMDTSIVIRTYVINGERIYFQAGGGIVSDSSPETEYQESLTKAQALKKILLGEEVNHDTADR